MTKRDYIELARIFRLARQLLADRPEDMPNMHPLPMIEFIQGQTAKLLARDNPRFNAESFEQACLLPEDKL